MEVSSLIEAILKRLPHRPGVYLMRDAERNIIYVGKAINLHHRVHSYFQSPQKHPPRTRQMVEHIADIDFYVASSEQEALIMELNFIKQYRPHYNVLLKDDKTFPYIKIDTTEKFPRLYVTRRFEQDGGRYFGPFSSAGSVKQTVRILKRLFPMRFCSKELTGKPLRPCLEFHLGHCLAPCSGNVTPAEYNQVIKEVILFLEGKRENVIRELKRRMDKASGDMQFENAARIRDQIQAVQVIIEGEKVAAVIRGDEDIIAFVQDNDHAYVQVLFVRHNKLTGRESFMMQGTKEVEPPEIMNGFIKQYYSASPQIPPLLLLQYPVEDKDAVAEWLKGKRGKSVNIEVPRRGVKKQLIDIAMENARQGLDQVKLKEILNSKSADTGLEELQKALKLENPPARMEAYDISNIQGTSAVGSMVVFEQGKPKPAHYRRFKIKTVEGANDYAMMQEVLQRRFKRSASAEQPASETWAIMPDLVLIDGGKGQLNAALEAVKSTGAAVNMIGLAKENEEIFLPKRKTPIVLPKSSHGLQLLQRLRDEAHRFAITYHSSLHRKKTFTSALDNVPGIGPRRKSALLRRFGTVPAIREATVDELVAATGMSPAQAQKVKELL